MNDRDIANIYQEYVVAHGLERAALLKELRARCTGSPTVLYPGSLIHVTPSFFFGHVVYVDRSDLSRDFFEKKQAVLDLISTRQKYRQRPYIRFLHQDFTQELPFPEESFDVLFALYASGISKCCTRYLKPGGWLLTNDHYGDARDAAAIPGLDLNAVVQEKRGKFLFTEQGLYRFLQSNDSARPYHRAATKADYYLFRKLPSGGRKMM